MKHVDLAGPESHKPLIIYTRARIFHAPEDPTSYGRDDFEQLSPYFLSMFY